MEPPCAVMSPMRAAGSPPIITVTDPFAMTSGGPAHVHMSVRGTESGVPIEQDIGWVFRFEGNRVAHGDAFLSWEEADAAAEGRAHA